MRQDPWEALCSFIISQNNNIPRIQGIVQRLCQHFGQRTPDGFLFPTPERMAALTVDLVPLRSGFRAKYLLSAAQLVSAGQVDLEALRVMPMEEARASLMQIVGVGPKVAECALLYGLHRLEAFPMDVWMKRAMAALFPGYQPEDFGNMPELPSSTFFTIAAATQKSSPTRPAGWCFARVAVGSLLGRGEKEAFLSDVSLCAALGFRFLLKKEACRKKACIFHRKYLFLFQRIVI